MIILKPEEDKFESEEIFINEFASKLSEERGNYVLEQIALEADLCFGRNKYCTPFFKERYPVK
jgi:hypothetical protein